MDDRSVARRRFLIGLAAGLVAGCTGDDTSTKPPATTRTRTPPPTSTPPPPTTTTASPPVDRDAALVAGVRRDKQHLVAAYRAASQRHPRLRRDLDALLAHHIAHLEVLGASPAGASHPARGRSARQAVIALQRRERQAVLDRRSDALAAGSGELARVLAAMAASSAQHVVVLDTLASPRRRGDR